jgi:site-specific recombinase XerD
MTPAEQLEKRREDLKSDDPKTQRFFEEKLKEWGREIMKKGIRSKTGHQYLIAVRSFFSHHYLDMKFRRGELKLEELPRVKASHRPKWVISNVELRAIFSVCNPRDRPLLLILASTGMSPTDVSQLRIEGLRLYEAPDQISSTSVYGVKPREKTGVPQHFVLGEEVLSCLEPLLSEREYPGEGFLLVTRKGNQYSQRTINRRMKTLAERALGEKAERFETKNLRDYFRNGLLLAEVNPEVQDAMLGWQRSGASQHYRISEAVILQAYDKARAHWSVDSARETAERVAKIESQVGNIILKYEQELEDLKKKYDAEAEQIRRQNAALEAKVEAHRKELEGHAGFIEDLRGELEANDRLFDLLTRFLFEKKEAGLDEWEKWLEEH